MPILTDLSIKQLEERRFEHCSCANKLAKKTTGSGPLKHCMAKTVDLALASCSSLELLPLDHLSFSECIAKSKLNNIH